MPFRVEWTAKQEGEIALPFQCQHCRAQSVVVVVVPLESGTEPARKRTAEKIGKLGTCSACGKRDEGGRKSLVSSIWLQTLGLAVLGFLIAFALKPDVPLLAVVVAAAAAIGVYRSRSNDLTLLDTFTRVLPVDEATPLLREVEAPKPGTPPKPVPLDEYDWLIPLGVLAVGVSLAVSFVGSRAWGMENDTTAQLVQFALALGGVGIIGWGLALQWEGRGHVRQVLRDRVLVAIGLLSFLGYFNFGHLHFGNFVHVWDTYHYVMGAKYFPELGYEKLYDCATVANVENGRRDEVARQTFTDLRTNQIIKTDEIVAHPERCKDSFSPARWTEFRQDIAAFRSFVNEGRWREIHLDHGYNATPVWTLAGYALTNTGPVTMEQLKRLNLIDPIYIALTVLMIWWAFGPRAFAIASVVLGCHFANRYYWTGGAFLRHDWLFYFVASICLLKKDRPMLAGAAFAYTTLLRLFPGLAAAGAAVAAFEYFRRNRKLDRVFVQYVAAGVVATAVLVGASFVSFGGAPTWQRFAQNTVKHANTPLTNHMGLRTILSWRPSDIGQKTVRPGLIDSWYLWKSTRLENWERSKPVMWLVFALGMWLVWRALKNTGTDLWLGAAMGTGFIVIGAELTNYYYCFLLGIAVLHAKKREVGLLLCALAAVSQYLNWGPAMWMSHWLDEQYVTMSMAALLAVGGIWWVFTENANAAVVPEEPEPVLLVATPAPERNDDSKKKKKGRK